MGVGLKGDRKGLARDAGSENPLVRGHAVAAHPPPGKGRYPGVRYAVACRMSLPAPRA